MKSSVFPPEKQLSQIPAVNSMSTSDNEQAQLLDHAMSEQVLFPVESKSRNRASAVVLGLALSMGTSTLLLPPQTKKVLAADSLPENSLLSLETHSAEASLSTPSPIASPVPSSLTLALTQAANTNPTTAPAGYNSVLKAGNDLLSLSKQTLATPAGLTALPPIPVTTPSPTVTVAATLTPAATPTVAPNPNLITPPAATVAHIPGFILPLSDAAHATPGAETTVSLATPTSSILPSPTSTIVAPTPTAAPNLATSPLIATTATSTLAPQVSIAPTSNSVQTPTLVDYSTPSIPVANGVEVSLLPQINKFSANRSTVKLAAVPTPTPSSTATTVANSVNSVQTPEPKLIAEDSESQSLTALLNSSNGPDTVSGQAPAEQLTTPESPAIISYRVNRGDTLNVIARQYRISVAELIAANNITNPNQIEVNQELKIPQTQRVRLNANVVRSTSSAIIATSTVTPDTSWTTTVPSAPVTSAPVTDVTATAANPYIQNLKAEIEALQRKYQQQARQITTISPSEISSNPPLSPVSQVTSPPVAAPQSATPVAVVSRAPVVKPPALEPVNPEFVNISSASPLPRPSANTAWKGQRISVRPTVQPQQVAVAPSAPTYYAPTIEAPGAQSLSPELPPLSAPNTYIPSDLPQSKGFIWPAKGVMTSGYGWRWGRMHRGLDIAAPTGTPILASATGVVEYAQWNSGGYGYLVDIRHPDGSLTRYGHNSRLLVREGQRVQQGQLIAEMGSTGFSTGPHCHFEIHPAGQGAVNPIAYLPQNRG